MKSIWLLLRMPVLILMIGGCVMLTLHLDESIPNANFHAENHMLEHTHKVNVQKTEFAGRVVKLVIESEDHLEQTHGSGIILNEEGDILTAYHIFDDMVRTAGDQGKWAIRQGNGDWHFQPLKCDVAVPAWDLCVIKGTPFSAFGLIWLADEFNDDSAISYVQGFFPNGHLADHPVVPMGHVSTTFTSEGWEIVSSGWQRLERYMAEAIDWGGFSGGGVWDEHGSFRGMLVAASPVGYLYVVPSKTIIEQLQTAGYDQTTNWVIEELHEF